MLRPVLAAALLCSGALACSSDPEQRSPTSNDAGVEVASDAGDTTPDASGPALTYYRDVKPIVDAKCNACHVPGGVGPLDFTDPNVVRDQAILIRVKVEQDDMPPWPPSNACNTYLHDRSLTPEQKQTIIDWSALGAPLGDPAEEGAELPKDFGGLTRVDRTATSPEPYLPRGGDDYRCFVLEWPEAEEKFVTGFNIVPSEPRIVHHVNIFSTEPAVAERFRTRDRNNAGAGYPCFGGAATESGVALLGAWAPGSLGIEYPPGTGLALEPGTVIILETHYSSPANNELTDQIALDVQYESFVEKRAFIIAFWDFVKWSRNGEMHIPANNPDVMHSVVLDPDGGLQAVAPWINSTDLLIHGTGLHMHYLGTRASLTIRRGTDSEECLIEIPRWKFHWQAGYLLETPMDFRLGRDTAYLECHWDNTDANQPVIDGTQRPAQDVNWGGSSADEMCIGYAYITEK